MAFKCREATRILWCVLQAWNLLRAFDTPDLRTFARRCTKFNGAFIYGMEGWVLLVIKTNTLPLEYCDVVLWTWLNSGKWKENKREKHAFINGKFPYLTFFCFLSSRRRWMDSCTRVLMKEGVRVGIGLN